MSAEVIWYSRGSPDAAAFAGRGLLIQGPATIYGGFSGDFAKLLELGNLPGVKK
jgi:hypothetical protein